MSPTLSRRSFFKMVGVAGVAAAGCGDAPARKLMPYVIPDEDVIPGMPAFYAGRCGECAAGCGVVARVREGRAIELEGNPSDPISGGALCARGQAALQGLYHPDRLPEPRMRQSDGRLAPLAWEAALDVLRQHLVAAAAAGEGRVALLGEPGVGPTLERLIRGWLASWRSDRWLAYEAMSEEPARAAGDLCFGRRALPEYRIDAAEVVVSFGAEFLETWRSPVEYTRQYAAFRVPHGPDGTRVGRLVYAGPRFGLTAANGDEWLPVRPGSEAALALGLLHVVLARRPLDDEWHALRRMAASWEPARTAERTGITAGDVERVGARLAEADGALALAGTEDVATHVASHLLNVATGSVGRTVRFLDGMQPSPASTPEEVVALLEAMRGGEVDVAVIVGANPVFTMPPEARVAEALRRVPFLVWCGGVPDETAHLAHLLLPVDHPLETWGDAAPRPGVLVLGQPVMQPVHATLPLGDVLLATRADAGDGAWEGTRGAVEATWREIHRQRGDASPFAAFWEQVRREGGLFEDAPVAPVELRLDTIGAAIEPPPPSRAELTLVAFPHIFLHDGRGADKPWLQEIPEPVSQLVWDTWIAVHPDTAERLGVRAGDVLELTSPHGALAAPVSPTPHVRPDVLAVPIGQGHTAYGRYAANRGANPWQVLGTGRRQVAVEARATGRRRELVSPQYGLDDMLGRPIAEAIALGDLARGVAPRYTEPEPPGRYELRPAHVYPAHQWGMTIDLSACTGCSACVAACYAENNVPVVGRENVARGQVMSWLRIERFVPRTSDAPLLHLIPMLCQHCDHAP